MRSHLLAACVGDVVVIAFFSFLGVERERKTIWCLFVSVCWLPPILPIVVVFVVVVVVVVVSTPTNLFMHVCALFANIYILIVLTSY